MARRGSKSAPGEFQIEKPIIDMLTLRLPRDQSARVEKFKTLNRLPMGELCIFLMNIAGINATGTNRVLVDYSQFDNEDDVRPTIDSSSMRLPREQSERMKTFKNGHRLSVGEMLIFMMDKAGIPKDGNTRMLIDYDTLTIGNENG